MAVADPKGPASVLVVGGRRGTDTGPGSAPKTVQSSLFLPEVAWELPDVSTLPDPATLDLWALDLETRDPLILTHGPGWPMHEGRVAGVALDWGEGGRYFPLSHGGGDNLPGTDGEHLRRWLVDALGRPATTVAMHNARYDLGWLLSWIGHDVLTVRAEVVDTLTLAALLNEYRPSYKLDDLGAEDIGARKDELLLRQAAAAMQLDPKADLWALPARYVAGYAAQDANMTRRLAALYQPLIVSRDLRDIATLEQEVSRLLLSMRSRGVRIDVARVKADYTAMRRERLRLTAATLPGSLDVWSPDLGQWLKAKGYVMPLTEKGRPSITKEWLDAGAKTDPLLKAIRRIRVIDKTAETFLKSYLIDKQVDGRLYPEFHPLRSDEGGTVTGRFSSSHPNFQNLPAVRDADDDEDIGRVVRGYVLPEEGEVWLAADYSQQEPRLAVHFASLLGLPSVKGLRDRYRSDPRTDFYQTVTEGADIERKRAKVISLGRIYGMGDVLMCRGMGLPVAIDKDSGRTVPGEEGRMVIDAFDRANPWMRQLSRRVQRVVQQRGFLRTLLGRRCRFRDDATGKIMVERGGREVSLHKFLNRLIQGSAADQTKAAMVALAKAGLLDQMRVTVHDEVGLSVVDTPTVRAEVAQIMTTCVTLEVPSAVDVEVGPSWGAAR